MTIMASLVLGALALFLALKLLRLLLGRRADAERPARPDPWQTLQSGDTPRHAAGGPEIRLAGFDQEDFLRGAKMLYVRLQESWDRRDVDDIANFATQAICDEVRAQAEADPVPSTTEIMLVNASLVSAERDGEEDVVSVYFDVLLRENQEAQTPSQIRELWHFTRPAGSAQSWRLDGIQNIA